MTWVVVIEKQTMKQMPRIVEERKFRTKEEALEFYQRNKRNGFPWTIHCYPIERKE